LETATLERQKCDPTRDALVSGLSHLAAVLWLFGGALVSGRVLYFRDLSTHYAPSYAFAAEALHRGVWPLWNPSANAGEPFLLVYPPDLLLLLIGGRLAPLGVGAALHLLLALMGGTALARWLGMGRWAAWLAGTVYGLGGFSLSLVNLVPLHQATAWAPWVIAAFLAAVRRPTRRRLVGLAALLALQVSTLGVEIVLQTVLVGLVLAEDRRWLRDRRAPRLLAAGFLALALAAPAVLGVRALIEGTSRGRGFPMPEALQFSLHPVILAEAVLPRLLGDPHAFGDADYWGRAFFPDGYPYLLTLYIGLPALLIALQACRQRRLWWLAGLGLLLSLGTYGPLGLLPDTWALPFRGPQKLFFLSHLPLALLAGFGIEAALGARAKRRLRVALALPGLALLLAVVFLRIDARAVRDGLARLVPSLVDPRGEVVARNTWPAAWLPAGLLALGTGLALARGGRWSHAAAGLVLLDLLIANGAANPLAPAAFYDLRPDVAALLMPAAVTGDGRWFSYGVAHSPGLRFEPVMARAPSDVWLYYLDRQSLLPSTAALDGLPSAFGLDRTGWAPEGSTLLPAEAAPASFGRHWRRLRLAGVRWILSFEALPADRVFPRGEVKLPEVRLPLRLYELASSLPRALWVPRYEVEADPARLRARLEEGSFDPHAVVMLSTPPPPGRGGDPARRSTVVYETVDPHTVRVRADTPPGFIVVPDGHHPDWKAGDQSGPVPLLRANGRYRAVPTPGGERVFTLRYQPAWRTPALVLFALGVLAVVTLALPGTLRVLVSHFAKPRARAVLFSARKLPNDRDPDTLGHDRSLTLLDHRVSIR
jgi:hypothetical protein